MLNPGGTQHFQHLFLQPMKMTDVGKGDCLKVLHTVAWTYTTAFRLAGGRRGIERLVNKSKQFCSFYSLSL